jgi:hypothetical protein
MRHPGSTKKDTCLPESNARSAPCANDRWVTHSCSRTSWSTSYIQSQQRTYVSTVAVCNAPLRNIDLLVGLTPRDFP